jgi:hypothetical protein
MGYDYGYLLGHESVANYESKNLNFPFSVTVIED